MTDFNRRLISYLEPWLHLCTSSEVISSQIYSEACRFLSNGKDAEHIKWGTNKLLFSLSKLKSFKAGLRPWESSCDRSVCLLPRPMVGSGFFLWWQNKFLHHRSMSSPQNGIISISAWQLKPLAFSKVGLKQQIKQSIFFLIQCLEVGYLESHFLCSNKILFCPLLGTDAETCMRIAGTYGEKSTCHGRFTGEAMVNFFLSLQFWGWNSFLVSSRWEWNLAHLI